MDTQQAEKPRLVAEAPALAKPGWIPPDTRWTEVQDLRDEHLRLLEARSVAGRAVSEIEHRHEAEDKERAEALRQAARQGVEPDLPEPTPPAQRRDELAAAEERHKAVEAALDDFLREAETFFAVNLDRFYGDLDATDAEAVERYEEAKRAADAARQEIASRKRLRMWLGRTAGRHPIMRATSARHFPWGLGPCRTRCLIARCRSASNAGSRTRRSSGSSVARSSQVRRRSATRSRHGRPRT